MLYRVEEDTVELIEEEVPKPKKKKRKKIRMGE